MASKSGLHYTVFPEARVVGWFILYNIAFMYLDVSIRSHKGSRLLYFELVYTSTRPNRGTTQNR